MKVYVPPLATSIENLKYRNPAICSVDHDKSMRFWDEFPYRMDIVRVANSGHNGHL